MLLNSYFEVLITLKSKEVIKLSYNNTKKSNKLLTFFYILIMLQFLYKILNYYGFVANNINTNKIVLIFNALLELYSAYLVLSNAKINKTVFWLLLFWGTSLFSTLINFAIYSGSIITTIIDMTFFVSIFLIISIEFKNYCDIQIISNVMLLFAFIYSVAFFFYKEGNGIINAGAINSIYYILLLLPFALLNKKTSLRISGILLILVMTLISNKRTATIIFVSAMVIYIFSYLFSKQKKTHMKIFMILSAILSYFVIMYIFNALSSTFDLNILKRFESLQEDGGSGRDDIYIAVISEIKTFSLFEWIFGRGFNSVSVTGGFGTSAHNDFLEVLYDCGIVGLVFYLSFVFRIILKTREIKNREHRIIYIISLVSFIVMSTFSHLILYPTYITYYAVLWCAIWSQNYNRFVHEGRPASENIAY